jgi:SAM-dependent methyltransferase
MWDVAEILQCPYCYSDLYRLHCLGCGRKYYRKNEMVYMFDPDEEHWEKCQEQIKALFRLDYQGDWKPRHDNAMYPYVNLKHAGLGQKANAAMFNVAYNGWASFRLAEHKKTVALDSSDHACYGVGSVPSTGKGIEKVIGDGCYLPFPENTFDIAFMASALHHMHDKVRAMSEAHRVLRHGGIFVAIGDKMMDDSEVEDIKQDGIRDYEGMPYTEDTLREWFGQCNFHAVKLLPIKYREGMECMGMELVAEHGDNAVIYGVKE